VQSTHMIRAETITRKQAKRLVELIERETRCEIMARFGRFDNLEFGEYAIKQIEYKDRIRRLLFGTSDLVELGTRWKMLTNRDRPRVRKKRPVRKKRKRSRV
jgi:hypothetical protein